MDKRTDYCGPDGTGVFARLLSLLIPDYIGFGPRRVYIGDCCSEHDNDNDLNGANKAGDEKLKECIRCKLREMLYSKRQILYYSNKYFVGVRFGNPFYKTFTELHKDLQREANRWRDKFKGR